MPVQKKHYNPMDFSSLRLKLASPENILHWSFGEVIKPETINYRTQRPEKDGLFSERIFGPTKDWECYCGKYRRIRYKGIICDKCGVEVTRSAVRRERMAHISLAAPVAHIWFFKNIPSQLSLLLDVPLPKLEKVIYYAAYIVTAVNEEKKNEALDQIQGEFKARKKNIEQEKGIKLEDLKEAMTATKKELESLNVGQILSEQQYHNLSARFGSVFKAGIGAEAIQHILKGIDLKKFEKEIAKEAEKEKVDSVKQSRILRRLKMVSSMAKNDMRPEWMIMNVLPVLPPDLRPMVALDGGRYATSDLNDLYRRVINRNNRLKKLMDLKAPDVIIINEKRMLQEAVDALIDNSARSGSQQMSSQRRPLRSLADMLKGKQGRFRQNLLGKRVDYSGRSVIVVGPHLKLSQCGIPKKMALELFRPFVIAQIIDRDMAHNVKNSNKLIEQAGPEIWAILEEVIQERKVLLNRAPTLHRMGIQAFEPLLIEELAIQLHPLVCPAFNADFDGDQMAVHLPLSTEAQREATERMLSSANLLKPATGEPIVVPSQDIVLGIYYLTSIKPKAKGTGKAFSSRQEALLALEGGIIEINALIKVHSEKLGVIETSAGRIIFNSALPVGFDFINEELNKKKLNKLVGKVIVEHGTEKTPAYLDAIKNIGFEYATKSGITWSIYDLIIPKEKKTIIADADTEVMKVTQQYEDGLLTNPERYTRVLSIWTEAKNKLVELVPKSIDPYGPIYSMINSGARGSWNQATQMFGMKGLVQNAQGNSIELPIKHSYKEGLNVLEYFISTHGARKGTTDTALKTAQAGYLTRRLVDVSQDLVIREDDCKTKKGIILYRKDSELVDYPLAERLFGRTALEDIKDGRKTVAKGGEIIGRKEAEAIDQLGLEEIQVRSPITCNTSYGLCSRCYGFDLGRNEVVRKGEAVGVVAAQSIGEPGTQLTMRTFHIGGVAGADITHGLPRVVEIFEARMPKGRAFIAQEAGTVTDIKREDLAKVVSVRPEGGGKTTKAASYQIPHTSEVLVSVGDAVEKGQKICEGNVDLKELFQRRTKEEVYREIVKGVQEVYTSEGASINDKHIEIIVKQMFSRVKIKDAGDTEFVPGEILEKSRFKHINREMKHAGKAPAKSMQMLMGITKVALSTESFLSAASFQETARVLIQASINGKSDRIRGLKENVIIGRVIPVGENYDGSLRFNQPGEEKIEEEEKEED